MSRQPDRKTERRVFINAAEAAAHAANNKVPGSYSFRTDSVVFIAKEPTIINPTVSYRRETKEEKAIRRWNTQRFGVID